MDALGALPMRQRTAVVLRYYLGATDNEIAEILGCEEKSVRSLTYRGTQTLRVVFAEDD